MIPGIEDLQGWIYPAWSPDGRKIAFTGSASDALEVFTCDANGGNKKQLTALKGINTYAAWSPDGRQIVFQHHLNGNDPGALYLMNADGTGQKELAPAEAPVEGGRPTWQPK
jgi:TolB protein